MGQPIAFLITFTTYGTRLHGDERGTVDKAHNQYGTPHRPQDDKLEAHRKKLMKHESTLISPAMRRIIRLTIMEVCETRGWRLAALNIRTNHVHVVVSFHGVRATKMMGDLKAYSTRNLRNANLVAADENVWTAGGSTRAIFDEDGLWRAVDYVENEQGSDLPEE
ncbi:MAG: transposase [Planctomycetes bacterium]|nr:transposase [Planctomycetota bacterium]